MGKINDMHNVWHPKMEEGKILTKNWANWKGNEIKEGLNILSAEH